MSVLPVVRYLRGSFANSCTTTYRNTPSCILHSHAGFRPQHTTQDVLVSMVDNWRKALDDNKLVGAVMVDLSKVFDMVNHSILLRKMDSYGVKGKELKWFQDYLTGRRQRVCVGDEKPE